MSSFIPIVPCWGIKKLNILPKVTELVLESELDPRKHGSKACVWTVLLYDPALMKVVTVWRVGRMACIIWKISFSMYNLVLQSIEWFSTAERPRLKDI